MEEAVAALEEGTCDPDVFAAYLAEQHERLHRDKEMMWKIWKKDPEFLEDEAGTLKEFDRALAMWAEGIELMDASLDHDDPKMLRRGLKRYRAGAELYMRFADHIEDLEEQGFSLDL